MCFALRHAFAGHVGASQCFGLACRRDWERAR
jgi:hypothetical protein